VVAAAGCTRSTAHRARTIAEIQRAFAHHGIRLIDFRGPSEVVGAGMLGSDHPRVDVRLYASDAAAERAKRGPQFILGGGTPHLARTRNVVATWFRDRDGAAVRAALRELR
jgi:hypothetical protein